MAASKPRTFDRNPGRVAATKPPRVFAVPPKLPERIGLAEPYPIGQRVAVRDAWGTVFNVTPCNCGPELSALLGAYCYVIELDERRWGSWFFMGHSSEVMPV